MKSGGNVILLSSAVRESLYLFHWFRGVLQQDFYFIFTCAAMAVFVRF